MVKRLIVNKETKKKLFGEKPILPMQNFEIVDSRLKKLEAFTTGVLVGQGMSYKKAVKMIERLED